MSSLIEGGFFSTFVMVSPTGHRPVQVPLLLKNGGGGEVATLSRMSANASASFALNGTCLVSWVSHASEAFARAHSLAIVISLGNDQDATPRLAF